MRPFLLLLATGAFAAEPPVLTRIAPLGGQRGTEIVVEVTGDRLDHATGLTFDTPHIRWIETTARAAKKLTGRIAIGAQAEPGPHIVRIASPNGPSAASIMQVGTLPALLETEPNDRTAQAQPVPSTPIEIYGELANRAETDFYAITAKGGERLTFDLRAIEHGSSLEAKMYLLDEAGHRIAVSDDRSDFDDAPFIEHRFARPGRYFLQVDQFHGPRAADAYNNTYLLRIGAFPAVTHLSRLGARAGETAHVVIGGTGLDAITQAELVAVRPAQYYRFTFPNVLPIRSGAAPTRITAAVTNAAFDVAVPAAAPPGLYRLWLHTAQGVLDTFNFEISTLPEHAENQPLRAPAVTNGVLTRPGEHDTLTVHAEAGRTLRIATLSAQLGMPSLDTVVEVRDAAGKKLAEGDDIASGAASLGNPDSMLFVTPQTTGPLTVTVRDRLDRGGPAYVYRLRAEHAIPSFHLWTLPDHIVVKRGAQVELRVQLAREPGFENQPVTLEVAGLPPGVRAEHEHIRADQAWELGADGLQMITPEQIIRFHAAADAAPGVYSMVITGRSGSQSRQALAVLNRGPLTNLFNFVRRPLPALEITVLE